MYICAVLQWVPSLARIDIVYSFYNICWYCFVFTCFRWTLNHLQHRRRCSYRVPGYLVTQVPGHPAIASALISRSLAHSTIQLKVKQKIILHSYTLYLFYWCNYLCIRILLELSILIAFILTETDSYQLRISYYCW